MMRLLEAFTYQKNEATFKKLQAYILKHPFCICMLTIDDIDMLKAHGFGFSQPGNFVRAG